MYSALGICILFSFQGINNSQAQSNGSTSPNERLSIVFETIGDKVTAEEGGQLVCPVTFDRKPLMVRSHVGLQFQGAPLLGSEVTMMDVKRSEVEQPHELYAGKVTLRID